MTRAQTAKGSSSNLKAQAQHKSAANGSSSDLKAQQKAAADEAERPDDQQPQLRKAAAAAAAAAADRDDAGGTDTPASKAPPRSSGSDLSRQSEDTTFTEQEAAEEERGGPEAACEEERRLREEREAKEAVAQEKALKELKEKMKDDRFATSAMAKLDQMLNTAVQYSSFITEQMTKYQEEMLGSKEQEDEAAKKDADNEKKGRKRRASSSAAGASPAKKSRKGGDATSATKALVPLIRGEMRTYQLMGVKWLISLWNNGLNGILADQMGLGKTVQTIAFLSHLRHKGIYGPFLVLGPLSTLPNWVNEFQRWFPDQPVQLYHGSKPERAELRKKWKGKGKEKDAMASFPVIVTSYEICMADVSHLQKVPFRYVVVDEGHRLKNSKCKLITLLKTIPASQKLLLTGTPLQNNLGELWSLLNFLMPDVFSRLEDFERWFDFGELGQEGADAAIVAQEQQHRVVSKLHDILRPFMLRRVKSEVESCLPGKMEVVLYAPMTPHQQKLNSQLLDNTLHERLQNERGGASQGVARLQNMLMQMRKVANHPDLLTSAFDKDLVEYPPAEQLVAECGKMALLDRLLTQLHARKHKVLIFSQMTKMLDLLHAYLEEKGHRVGRIDGSIKWQDRQDDMNAFNLDPNMFVFLLSTRAGGLGINLATADTVVIFDSDWNPQNDLQAMSRAHRIGQSQTVNIYRLLTSGSVEEDILERAKQKMVLDHLVIQRMDTSGRTVLGPTAAVASAKQMFGKDEMAAILRFGAEALFKENESEVADKSKALYEDSIDAILARAEVVDEGAGKNEGADELLSAFNVATFKSAEDDKAFWNRLIPADTRTDTDKKKDLGVRTARLKNMADPPPPKRTRAPADPDASESDPGSPTGSEAYTAPSEQKGKRKARSDRGADSGARGRKRSHMASPLPGGPVAGADVRLDRWPPSTDADGRELEDQADGRRVIGRRDAGVFVRAVRHHGLQSRLPKIAQEVGRVVVQAPEEALLGLWFGLLRGCDDAMAAAISAGKPAKDAVLDFYGVPVKAQDVRQFVDRMRLLADKVEELEDPAAEFAITPAMQATVPKWAKACDWTLHDDAMLLLGVYRHGMDNWVAVAQDEELGLTDKLAAAGEKAATGGLKADDDGAMLPRGSHLDTRVKALLVKLDSWGGAGPRGTGRTRSKGTRATGSRSARTRGGGGGGGGGGTRRERGGGPGTLEWEQAEHLGLNGIDAIGPGPKPTAAQHQAIMAEVWTDVQRLKALQKQQANMAQDDIVKAVKTCMLAIGDCIQAHVDSRGGDPTGKIEARLWSYINKTTDNSRPGPQLASLYTKLRDKRDKAAASGAEAATDATEDAEAVAAAGGALDVKPRAEKAVKPGKAPKVEEADVKSLAPKLEPKLESQADERKAPLAALPDLSGAAAGGWQGKPGGGHQWAGSLPPQLGAQGGTGWPAGLGNYMGPSVPWTGGDAGGALPNTLFTGAPGQQPGIPQPGSGFGTAVITGAPIGGAPGSGRGAGATVVGPGFQTAGSEVLVQNPSALQSHDSGGLLPASVSPPAGKSPADAPPAGRSPPADDSAALAASEEPRDSEAAAVTAAAQGADEPVAPASSAPAGASAHGNPEPQSSPPPPPQDELAASQPAAASESKPQDASSAPAAGPVTADKAAAESTPASNARADAPAEPAPPPPPATDPQPEAGSAAPNDTAEA